MKSINNGIDTNNVISKILISKAYSEGQILRAAARRKEQLLRQQALFIKVAPLARQDKLSHIPARRSTGPSP